MYIFRWVISSDLDMRALEQLSLVCRGFYICARSAAPVLCPRVTNMLSMRDVMSHNLGITLSCFHLRREPELWHSACVRVWGRNCTNFVPFKSWRDMFLRRPRVRFDGKRMFYLLIDWLCVRVHKTSTVPLYFSNPQKRLLQNLTNHVNAALVCSLLAEPE